HDLATRQRTCGKIDKGVQYCEAVGRFASPAFWLPVRCGRRRRFHRRQNATARQDRRGWHYSSPPSSSLAGCVCFHNAPSEALDSSAAFLASTLKLCSRRSNL